MILSGFTSGIDSDNILSGYEQEGKEEFMKRNNKKSDELWDEYDFRKLKGGVRGKYAKRFKAGTNLDACPCLRRGDIPAQA